MGRVWTPRKMQAESYFGTGMWSAADVQRVLELFENDLDDSAKLVLLDRRQVIEARLHRQYKPLKL